MGNRLKDQSSPYLLQHAENPVDWFPWCDEAFQKAETEDKPVFLSIGYSTCHWCHVMARESFQNQEIADILNRCFVAVKVDREERPDIDSVYMSVCQAFTGNGGWPMSVFLTADQKPFFAGTYFPPVSGAPYGMGFRELLLTIAEKWKQDRGSLTASAEDICALLNSGMETGCGEIDTGLPKRAAMLFSQSFDKKNGGFGAAPKFPVPHNLIFLMLYGKLLKEQTLDSQVVFTLEQMRRGGIFDHIGYGFCRYSTDERYLVPHFEKMLYDNALLILAYSCAYKAYGNPLFLDTAEQTAEYVFREMTGGQGQFYTAQDADSEGEEGRFYVWQYDEVCRLLGTEKGKAFCKYYGITKQGNFEGKNIPNLLNGHPVSDVFDQERRLLYNYRRQRAQIHLDDKILTAWNALMICALSCLYRVSGKKMYLDAAQAAQKYINDNLADGRCLYTSCRGKRRSVNGFLDTYTFDTAALISLYEVTADPVYLKQAEALCTEAMEQFADKNGGYFLYGNKNHALIAKPKETYDGALPSGNSVMAYCLVQLARLSEKQDFQKAAEKQLAFLSKAAAQYPAGSSMYLIALLLHENQPPEITVVLSKEDDPGEIIAGMPLYADIKVLQQPDENYKLINGKTTYYMCKDHTCFPPSNCISV